MTVKSLISILLVFMILAILCACGEKASLATTVPTQSATASSGPVHHHSYRDADCETPKTCTDCGYTRGSALGHDYAEGVCSRCGNTDATYLPLLETEWSAVAVSENGKQLEIVVLRFDSNSCSISSVLYDRLSDIPMDQWDANMRNEENWYDYGGEVYYRKQKTTMQTLSYSTNGNQITCELLGNDAVLGTLILERTAGHTLNVTYFEGAFNVQFLAVGDVFNGD